MRKKLTNFKTLTSIGLVLFLAMAFYPVYASGGSAAREAEIPEIDGVYDVPGHKNLKVRVFVYKAPARPAAPEPSLVCALPDNDSQSVVGSTGWKLPAAWNYRLNIASAPSALQPYVETIVDNSFDAWQASTVPVAVSRYSDSAIGRQGLDGVNLIAWGRTSGSALAVTYTWYYPESGEVVETDTIMNKKFGWSWSDPAGWTDSSSTCAYTGVYDAQNIMTHELGHWFGLLDHYSAEYTDNTMYGYGSKAETKKDTLTAGDIAGLEAIYNF